MRDKRLRSSVLINHKGSNYVIDTGPDFRQQVLRTGIKELDAVLFTHEHKDHLAGLDDVRPFNFVQQKDMLVFCSQQVEKALRREFHYVFSGVKYPGIPKLSIQRIGREPFDLPSGLRVVPIEVMHYKLPVLGFRMGDFTYITDAKTISAKEREKVKGTRVLVVNALQHSSHLSHFNLEEALAFIAEIQPERAYLTHISHLLGTHDEVEKGLPKHVSLAYDGLSIAI
jgi:phosphoribosyl 1,2-cyclic phosphate phosphodiesterase